MGSRELHGAAVRRRGDRGAHRGALHALALTTCAVALACGDASIPAPTSSAATTATEAPPPSSSATVDDAPSASGAPSSAPSAASTVASGPQCRAPSLALAGAIDAYDEAAIATCQKLEKGTKKCGAKPKPVDMERFEASALPIDPDTEERIVRVATLGKQKGMDPRSFALVGDSITVFRDFMRPFMAKSAYSVKLAPEVSKAFALDAGASASGDATVVEWYRGHAVETWKGQPIDAFAADRAAKVGARASWPLAGGAASPLISLVDRIHPAIAIVTFGANDAAYRPAPPEELAAEFEKNMLEVIAALEARGVVVILENEMRHGDQPGVKACPSDDLASNDWRTAVSTNRIVRRTAEIACREHLPFVDFRWALEGATAHGLGPDAVHPSIHGKHGGGHLDELGLDCGFNIRTLVTLLELRNVVNALVRRGVFPPLGASAP